jgi:hypothetical protein
MILPYLLLAACSSDLGVSPDAGSIRAQFAADSSEIAPAVGSLARCGVLRVSRTSLDVGSTATYSVVREGATSRLRGSKPEVASSQSAVVALTSATTMKGIAVGKAVLVATAKTCVDSIELVVVAASDTTSAVAPPPPPATPPATPPGDGLVPPPSISSIAVRALRDGGVPGTALVVSGIPLKPGALFPAHLPNVRLTLNGTPIPLAVKALRGRHKDGSLRAMAVQAQLSFGTTLLTGALEIAAAPVSQSTWNAGVADVNAAILPTDPNYLLSTTMFGGTVPVNASPNARYEQQFTSNADRFWSVDGADWGLANYYDRALSHYVYWARSGDPKWYFRAGAIARDYRRKYVEPNAFLVSPHWSQMEGLALNHWLAADDSSGKAVANAASRMTGTFTPALIGTQGAEFSEGRIVQRMLLLALLAWELGDTSENWSTKVDGYVNGLISSQRADGGYSWPNWCGGQANYMTGLQNDALVKAYERFRADERILATVRKSVDYMWATQWAPESKAFRYASHTCPSLGPGEAETIAPDLNGLILVGFAWVGKRLNDVAYTNRTELIAQGMIEGAWLTGSKQFNQSYYDSHLWLGYR